MSVLTAGQAVRLFSQMDENTPLTFASSDGVVDINHVSVGRLINPPQVYSADDILFTDIIVLAAKKIDLQEQGIVNQRVYFGKGD